MSFWFSVFKCIGSGDCHRPRGSGRPRLPIRPTAPPSVRQASRRRLLPCKSPPKRGFRGGSNLQTRPPAAGLRPSASPYSSGKPLLRRLLPSFGLLRLPIRPTDLFSISSFRASPLQGGDLGVGPICRRGHRPRGSGRQCLPIRPASLSPLAPSYCWILTSCSR